jgi:hypothetical protein
MIYFYYNNNFNLIINNIMNKEYRFTTWLFEIFDLWLDDNLEHIRELNLLDKIDLIQNTDKDFYNVCEKLIDNNYIEIKIGKKTIILDYDWEYIETSFTDEEIEKWIDISKEATEKEICKARNILKTRTIVISARWYSSSEYDQYIIVVENARYKKEVEENFQWLKQVFTIIQTRVSLEVKEYIEDNNTKYFSEWEEVDTEYSTEEFADIEDMCRELVKRNSCKEIESLEYLTNAEYIW